MEQDSGTAYRQRGDIEKMLERIKALVWDDQGPTAIEYGLIAALIAVAIIVALTFLGTTLANLFNYVGGKVNK